MSSLINPAETCCTVFHVYTVLMHFQAFDVWCPAAFKCISSPRYHCSVISHYRWPYSIRTYLTSACDGHLLPFSCFSLGAPRLFLHVSLFSLYISPHCKAGTFIPCGHGSKPAMAWNYNVPLECKKKKDRDTFCAVAVVTLKTLFCFMCESNCQMDLNRCCQKPNLLLY